MKGASESTMNQNLLKYTPVKYTDCTFSRVV